MQALSMKTHLRSLQRTSNLCQTRACPRTGTLPRSVRVMSSRPKSASHISNMKPILKSASNSPRFSTTRAFLSPFKVQRPATPNSLVHKTALSSQLNPIRSSQLQLINKNKILMQSTIQIAFGSVFANELSKGDYIVRKGKIFQITQKPEQIFKGRGGSSILVKAVDIVKGAKLEERIRSDAKVDVEDVQSWHGSIEVDEKGNYSFINSREEFSDLDLDASLIGENMKWLHPSVSDLEWKVLVNEEEEPLVVDIGQRATVHLAEVPGDEDMRDHKVINIGDLRFKVPNHISAGDSVIINPKDGAYIGRA